MNYKTAYTVSQLQTLYQMPALVTPILWSYRETCIGDPQSQIVDVEASSSPSRLTQTIHTIDTESIQNVPSTTMSAPEGEDQTLWRSELSRTAKRSDPVQGTLHVRFDSCPAFVTSSILEPGWLD